MLAWLKWGALAALLALLAWKVHVADRLAAELAASEASLSAARTANETSRQSFDALAALSDLGFAAVEAADAAGRERAAFVGKTKEIARNAPRPPDACATVGPYTGAVLDRLRHRAAHRNPADAGEAAPAADGVRR